MQIARPAAAERQARERALQVRAPLELGAQIGAQRRGVQQGLDGIETLADRLGRGQRRREAGREQAAAGGGHGAVHRGEQAALALAGEAREQLEVAPRRGIDQQVGARHNAARRQKAGQTSFLGQLDVADQRATGAELGPGEGAEAIERSDPEARLQPALAREGIELVIG